MSAASTFKGPYLSLSIEPDIDVTIGRSRAIDNAVALEVHRADGALLSSITIPIAEVKQAMKTLDALL
jgi:hypothetical protein